MSDWTPQDWGVFLTLAGTAATGFYLSVVRPLLAQLRDLIAALRENTSATDTSAAALTVLAPVVTTNSVVTQAASDALQDGPTR